MRRFWAPNSGSDHDAVIQNQCREDSQLYFENFDVLKYPNKLNRQMCIFNEKGILVFRLINLFTHATTTSQFSNSPSQLCPTQIMIISER